jgi:PAS domain S-box-containing protein
MADSLEQREDDLNNELVRSRHAYDTLQLTINSMKEGLIAVDTLGRVLLFNQAASALFLMDDSPLLLSGEWPRHHGLYMPGTDHLYTTDSLPLVKALGGKSGSTQHIWVRNPLHPQGRLISASFHPMMGDKGPKGEIGVIGALMVFADITRLQQMQLEQAKGFIELQETQRRLMEAQRLGRMGNWELDVATQKLWWSDECYELFGLDRTEFDGRHETLLNLIHPDDRAHYDEQRQIAWRDGVEFETEYRIITPTGEIRWMHTLGRPRRMGADDVNTRSGVVQDITALKKPELALAESYARLSETQRKLLDAQRLGRIGNWELNPKTQGLWVSDEIYELFGIEKGSVEFNMEYLLKVVHPEDLKRYSNHLKKAHRTALELDIEYRITTPAGEERWMHQIGRSYNADDVNKTYRAGVVQDISVRKRAEQALTDSEQRYMALFESTPLPLWVFDRETLRFLTVNAAAIDQYGYSREEFLAMTVMDIRHERERAWSLKHFSKPFTGETVVVMHRKKNGQEFAVQVVARPIQYEGRAGRFVVALDISARVKAEKDVQDQLFTLQRAADAAQAITSHQTLSAAMQEVADQACGVVGAHHALVMLAEQGTRGPSVYGLSLSEKYAQYRSLSEPVEGSGIYAMVCETKRPIRLAQAELKAHPLWKGFGTYEDKHPAMRGLLAVPLMGRDGQSIGVLQLSDKYEGEFTLQDEYVVIELAQLAATALENARLFDEIHRLNLGLEQKVAERTEALSRQEALFRTLTDQAPQVIWTVDRKGEATYFNRAFMELVGGESDHWTGLKWLRLIHPEDLPDVRQGWQVAKQQRVRFENIRRMRGQDGAWHIMSCSASPVFSDSGEIDFWVGIDTDITNIKATEAALRLSNQELEAFSYSVSHDLRSPLNTVDGFSRLLSKQLSAEASEKSRHYLSRIQAGVAQMGHLIEDLLSLAQVSRMQLGVEMVDISVLAQYVVDEWRVRAPDRDVHVSIEPGLLVQGDARLLRVAMENLIGNAWKFTSQRERAEITVGQTHQADNEPVFFVRDNGAGFDMAYADKLFTAFQRLHGAQEFPGSGIGLATVSRVIGRHGGRLWADAKPDSGACFYFTLPGSAAGSSSISLLSD